jgi:[ribosomal protein S5]-alanine N-acetyltransferase
MNGARPTPVFPALETERLLLREVTMRDLAWFFEHVSRPEIVHGHGRQAPVDIDAAVVELKTFFIDPLAHGSGVRWGLALKSSGLLVGAAALHHVDQARHGAELGYDLAPAHWGRGLMTEALGPVLEYGFGAMGLLRIEAVTVADNMRSQHLLVQLGFVEEGVLRRHGLDEHDELCDEVVFSLLNDERPEHGRA